MHKTKKSWISGLQTLSTQVICFYLVLLTGVLDGQAQERAWRIGPTFSAYALPHLEQEAYQIGVQAVRQWKPHWFWEGSISISDTERVGYNDIGMPFVEDIRFLPLRLGLVGSAPHFRLPKLWLSLKVGLGLLKVQSNIIFDRFPQGPHDGFVPAHQEWLWGPYVGLGMDVRLGKKFSFPIDLIYQGSFRMQDKASYWYRSSEKKLDSMMVTVGVMRFM